MIGDKPFLSFENRKGGKITFGDGKSTKVYGKSLIVNDGMPKLDDVLYGIGIRANLLYQLCEKKLSVSISK